MAYFKKHPFFLLLLLGLFLRLTLLFIDYSWDVNNHIAWAKDLWQRGFKDFYETRSSEVYATPYPNYPPLSLYIFYLLYPVQTIIYKIAWFFNITFPIFPSKLIFFIQSRTFLAGILKLPSIFSDLGIAYLCYLTTKRLFPKNLKVQKLAAVFILFNPAFIFNSALWGQIDSVPIFFVLLSMYLLLFIKRYILSAFIFSLALLVKPTALVFLPIYVIFFINKYSLVSFLKAFLIGNFIIIIFFLPFMKNIPGLFYPYLVYSEKILATQSLPFVTNGAFNFWVLITGFQGIKDISIFLFGISYRMWGYIIVGSFFSLIIHYSLKLKNKVPVFFSATFLSAFAAFLFLTKMHERYSLLPLPFLLLASLKKPKLLRWFIILSILSFLNHYHSWPVPKVGIFTDILYYPAVSFAISLLNVFSFLYLFRRIIVRENEA